MHIKEEVSQWNGGSYREVRNNNLEHGVKIAGRELYHGSESTSYNEAKNAGKQNRRGRDEAAAKDEERGRYDTKE